MAEYCRDLKQKSKYLKTKFKDYEQDILGHFEVEALVKQVGNIDTISKKRLIKEIKRLVNLQKNAAKMSVLGKMYVLGVVISSNWEA